MSLAAAKQDFNAYEGVCKLLRQSSARGETQPVPALCKETIPYM